MSLANGAYIKPSPSIFSPAQVSEWLKTIGYPNSSHPEPTLENLALLSRSHLVAFPFENLDMHYSSEHIMNVDPEYVFKALVVEREKGRGSYCFGKNGLLLQMLRGLGYRAYAGQGRVNEAMNPSDPPQFTSLVHMVIFVQPIVESPTTTYMLDIGFGGGGLVRPILLSDAPDNFVVGGTQSERHRLSRGHHPSSIVDGAPPSWCLQVQHFKDNEWSPWRTQYAFTETEFFQTDFDASSYFVSTHPTRSAFLREVVCVKYFFLENKEDLGYVTLYRGKLKKHLGAVTEDVTDSKTEEDRLEVIKNNFGIQIEEKEALANVKGRFAAL